MYTNGVSSDLPRSFAVEGYSHYKVADGWYAGQQPPHRRPGSTTGHNQMPRSTTGACDDHYSSYHHQHT